MSGRCATCGRRWCVCIPAGASVDWAAAQEGAPVLGPDLPGEDAEQEVIESIADILHMPPEATETELRKVVDLYGGETIASALLYVLQVRGCQGPG